jgi:hypothetical protein
MRLCPLLDPFGKPPHIAMLTRGNECREALACFGSEGCFAESDRVEAKFQGAVPNKVPSLDHGDVRGNTFAAFRGVGTRSVSPT